MDVGTWDDVLVIVGVFVAEGGVPVQVSVMVPVADGLKYGVFVRVAVPVMLGVAVLVHVPVIVLV